MLPEYLVFSIVPMIIGLILTMATGLLWCVIGSLLTAARRGGCRVDHFYVVASLGALAVLIPYQLITGTLIPTEWSWPIAWCIIGNALFNVVANFFAMLTLGKGNAAVYFGLCRMGFAVSFVWAVLVWGEKTTFYNVTGIVCLIAAVFLTAKGGKQDSAADSKWNHKCLVLCIISLLAGGAAQLCLMQAERLHGTNLPFLTKSELLLVTYAICFGIGTLAVRSKERVNMAVLLKTGLAWSVVAVTSYGCLFAALHRMGEIGRGGILFPIACATQILSFCVATPILFHERFTRQQIAAIALIVIGIFAAASSRKKDEAQQKAFNLWREERTVFVVRSQKTE